MTIATRYEREIRWWRIGVPGEGHRDARASRRVSVATISFCLVSVSVLSLNLSHISL